MRDTKVAGSFADDPTNPRERLLDLLLAAERKRRDDAPTIAPRGQWNRPLRLSHAQERLWFLDQVGLVGAAYNVPLVFRLSGGLDGEALQRSFAELVRRHESLRTRFEVRDGVPYQIIDPPGCFALDQVDLSCVKDRVEREQLLRSMVQRERMQRLDLCERGPLRVLLVRLGDQQHALVVTLHHIASDGWSLALIVRELSALYTAYCRGQKSPLPELPVQYADYTIWQREWLQGEILEAQLRYWREKLRGAPPQLSLPTDRARPSVESFKGATLRFEFPRLLSEALRRLAGREGATVFMVFLAAYQILLSRWSGESDIVVGSPIAGRRHRELQGLIGFFVNTLVLRTEVDADRTFREFLARVKEVTLEAYAHQELPFEVLVKALRPERNLTRQAIFQVGLALQNHPEGHLDLPDILCTPLEAEWTTTHFDLMLFIYESGEQISAEFEYSTDLFDRETIERIAVSYRTLLTGIVSEPSNLVRQLPLLAETERSQLLAQWNTTSILDFRQSCIHQLFEDQVERTPDLIAAICSGNSISYSELDARADQLARYLQARTVGPEKLVGICIERSLEMIVAILAILKAGGAYVPLDPAYPPERLAYILDDAKPTVLLTQESLIGRFPKSVEIVAIDVQWDEIARSVPDSLPRGSVSSDNLAYVIYTSGSTGNPKGVMVSHGSVTRLFAATKVWFGFGEADVWTLFHSIAFDFSVWELWGALLFGGRVVVVPYSMARSPHDLYRLVCEQGVTMLNQTPSAFTQFVDAQELSRSSGHALRFVIFGGEALDPRTLRPWTARNGIARPRLVNMYGITETTVHVTYWELTSRDIDSDHGSPVGGPLTDLQVYLLDPARQPVPEGFPAELYVGGRGVTRGYLNRPALTAERFVAHPFSTDSNARVYKTGDLGRWHQNGSIDYLGRNDDQVKVRGFRIELGEIESALMQHPAVKRCLVLAREDVPGDRRLAAYVVAKRELATNTSTRESATKLRSIVVREWKSLYEGTYGGQGVAAGPSFIGWNSSYTGQPIPHSEMQEWLDTTVERIRGAKPKKVLEIGCGVGLILQRVAPECEEYLGIDFSEAGLEKVANWAGERRELAHVRLRKCSATELDDLAPGSFDTVVMNSVVQYFPDVEYLIEVLAGAIRVVQPGGTIFIGDIRDLGLMSTFHSAVQLEKASSSVTVGQLRARIARAITQDKELVIDPQLFEVLPGQLPGISAAEIHVKRGKSENELTKYRYDVVLKVHERVANRIEPLTLSWKSAFGAISRFESNLAERLWTQGRIDGAPNGRVAKDIVAQGAIEASDETLDVGTLRRRVDAIHFDAVDPEEIYRIAAAQGYSVEVRPDKQGKLDIRLSLSNEEGPPLLRAFTTQAARKAWRAYANDPLESGFRQQLVPTLREYLRCRLPEYMVPSGWVVLDELPLTSNGKIDRRRLPMPHARGESAGEYVAPRSAVERTLAEIWEQLLQVDRVGIRDNFFELGGHSLHGMKLIAKVAERLMVDLPVVLLFKYPTIEEMTPVVESLQLGSRKRPPLDEVEYEGGIIV